MCERQYAAATAALQSRWRSLLFRAPDAVAHRDSGLVRDLRAPAAVALEGLGLLRDFRAPAAVALRAVVCLPSLRGSRASRGVSQPTTVRLHNSAFIKNHKLWDKIHAR